MRLVVNYRQLNENTKKTHYPIPHINELLDMLLVITATYCLLSMQVQVIGK